MSKPVFEDPFNFPVRRNRKSYILLCLSLGCMFLLFYLLSFAITVALHNMYGMSFGVFIVPFAVFSFPMMSLLVISVAATVQRCHDCDWSGWLVLVPLIGIFLLFRKGTTGANRFGRDQLGGIDLEQTAQVFN